MIKKYVSFVLILSFATLAYAGPNHLKSIFNGKNLDGWIQKNGSASYRVEDGAIIGKTGNGKLNSFLCSEKEYGDFELEFEVKLIDSQLNSGVQIRSTTREAKDGEKFGVVNGPQVEIAANGNDGSLSGYVYGESIGGWMTHKNKLIPHKAFIDGEWNSFRVVAKGARIQTWINGKQIEDLLDEAKLKTHPKGFIGLQVHTVVEGTGPFQVAWRHIRIKELSN
jgi:hypothetical protein